MKIPYWVAKLARNFWRDVGEPEPFPRDLRMPVCAFGLAVKDLPGLRASAVRAWMRDRGEEYPCGGPDRPLRACLVAGSGLGFVFLDADDPADEQRFSLAHELGHYLRDSWQPRQLACERLGPRAAEVLDGRRPPTPAERLSAVLGRVPLGLHTHLMLRDSAGRFATAAIAAAERSADRLAYELLAPAAAVCARVGDAVPVDRGAVAGVLREGYGLPAVQALDYAELLFPSGPPPDPLLRRLGLRARRSGFPA